MSEEHGEPDKSWESGGTRREEEEYPRGRLLENRLVCGRLAKERRASGAGGLSSRRSTEASEGVRRGLRGTEETSALRLRIVRIRIAAKQARSPSCRLVRSSVCVGRGAEEIAPASSRLAEETSSLSGLSLLLLLLLLLALRCCISKETC